MSSRLSVDLIAHLRKEGRTLEAIGKMIGVSKAFVSRVARGERSFTLEHIERFERALKQPVPLLLLSVWKERIPAAQRQGFDRGLALLRNSVRLRGALARRTRSAKS